MMESPCNWIGRIIIKIPILHTTKLIYRFNAIPIKILILDFTGLEKKTKQEFLWNLKRPQTRAKAMLGAVTPQGFTALSGRARGHCSRPEASLDHRSRAECPQRWAC